MSSGSPAVFVLRLPQDKATPKTVDGALALTRRGTTMLRAKRAMEELLANGRAFVEVPMVEDLKALTAELAAAEIAAAPAVDVRGLRERLRLTRASSSRSATAWRSKP